MSKLEKPSKTKLEQIAEQINMPFEPNEHANATVQVYPPENLMTQELWDERMKADEEHTASRPGHALSVEYSQPANMPCQRKVCGCGWAGEWINARMLQGVQ